MDIKNFKNINTIKQINPLGLRVVVQILPQDQTTSSGLYLPEGALKKSAESVLAKVISVASAKDIENDEYTNISGIPLNAVVLIRTDEGIQIPWDKNLRIVETQNVLAIVSEIDVY